MPCDVLCFMVDEYLTLVSAYLLLAYNLNLSQYIILAAGRVFFSETQSMVISTSRKMI